MLDFEECETSGNMRADGNKGTYWMITEAWTTVELVKPTPAGPKVEKVGVFNDAEDAIKFTNTFDNMTEEEE